jgi:chromosome segregation ATPase
LLKDIELLKTEIFGKEKKIGEVETELEKTRKNYEALLKFKNERDNLILENTRLDSEVKRLKYELNENISQLDRSNIQLRNKEDSLAKLMEEMNYVTFNTKRFKQEADKSLQDAVTYQQILRKMEKDLSESQTKTEKLEKELSIIKQQMFKK